MAAGARAVQPETATPREEALSELVWWMLGERDALPPMPEHVPGAPRRNYWWRRELRDRFDAIYAKYPCSGVVAVPVQDAPPDACKVCGCEVKTAAQDALTTQLEDVRLWIQKQADECLDTAERIERRVDTGRELNGDALTAAHYRKNQEFFQSKATAVEAALRRKAGGE